MKTESFINLLIEGDNNKINEFVIRNGKKQKPTNPLYKTERIMIKRVTSKGGQR